MQIFSKRFQKKIKLILVSYDLEWYINFLMLTSILILIFFYTIQFKSNFNINNLLTLNKLEEKIQEVNTLEGFYNFLEFTINQYFIRGDGLGLSILLGGVRIIQYPIEQPAICNQIDYLFKRECNYKNGEEIEKYIPQKLTVLNQSLCIEKDCKEFQKTSNPDIFKMQTKYLGTYPTSGFYLDIQFNSSTDYIEQVNKLKLNGWLSFEVSRAIGLKMSIIYPETLFIDILDFSIENWDGTYTPYYQIKHLFPQQISQDILLLAILFVYTIAGCINFMKIMFECNLLETPTQIIQTVFNILEVTFGITYISEQFLVDEKIRQQNIYEMNSKSNYIELGEVIDAQNYRCLLFIAGTIMVPYRILFFMTTKKYFEDLIYFSNSIYRTLFPLVNYVLFFAVFIISWVLGLFKAMRKFNLEYESFFQTLITFVQGEKNKTSQNLDFYSELDPNLYEYYNFMIFLMKLYLIFQAFLLVSFSISQANDIEFQYKKPFEIQSLELFYNITRLIENFRKSTISLLEGKKLQEQNIKKIIWLNCGQIQKNQKFDFQKKLMENDIKLSEFDWPEDTCKFLEYLFKLRPNLLYKSQNYFRIILEYFQEDSQKDTITYQDSFVQNTEILLSILKDQGGSIPILIFEFSPMNTYQKTSFLKIYKNIFFTNKETQFLDFSLLKPINDFLEINQQIQQLQKKQMSAQNSFSQINFD